MIDFRNTVIETAMQQLAATEPFVWLIEVGIPSDPATRFRITSYSQAITRGTDRDGNPIIYYPFPVAHGDLLDQARGNLNSISINVANVTLELMTYLEQYDGLSDQPVVLKLVHSQGLADPGAERRFDGRVSNVKVTDEGATFLVSATNVTKSKFPKQRLLAFDCVHAGVKFGGVQCGYNIPAVATNEVGGGFDFCAGSLEECEERGEDEVAHGLDRNHPLRYGGCPGLKLGAP